MKSDAPIPGQPFDPRQRGLFGFVKCPAGLLRSTAMTPGAKLCWALLADLCGDDGCFPTHKRLADGLGISIESVKRYLRELRAAGLIRTERPESDQDCRRNGYQFIWQDALRYGSDTTPNDKCIKGSDVTPNSAEYGSDTTPKYGSDVTPNGEKKGSKVHEIGVKSARAYKEYSDLLQTAAATSSQQQESSETKNADYPEADALIHGKFSSADSNLVAVVVRQSLKAYGAVKNPKIPKPTDAVFARAINCACGERAEAGPGMLTVSVPIVIRNWAERGMPPDPVAKPPGKATPVVDLDSIDMNLPMEDLQKWGA